MSDAHLERAALGKYRTKKPLKAFFNRLVDASIWVRVMRVFQKNLACHSELKKITGPNPCRGSGLFRLRLYVMKRDYDTHGWSCVNCLRKKNRKTTTSSFFDWHEHRI